MANNVTIEIKLLTAKAGSNVKALAGETKDLKKKIESATDSIQDNRDEQGRFTSQTKKTTDSVEQQGSGFERLKAKANSSLGKAGLVGLYAGAGLAATAMVSRAVRSGREFEQQLADLEAITGITGEQLEDLADQALETSVQYGESAANIIEANKLVASQLAEKIDFGTAEGAAELSKISEEAIVLQKAAGVDLPTAVKTLTTAINQFNLPASESARIINSIAAGSKFGAAEVADQAEAYKQAGSVAAGAKLSFEQLNATVQVLAANAITGSQAGTNIRGVLLSLQNSAKLAEAGIEGVSLETDGYAGTLEALKPLLNDTIALEKLFGRENIASARILIQNAESVEEMTEKVTGGNVAYQQAAVQLDTFNGAQGRLSAAIDSQLIPAFTASGGAMVSLMNITTDLIGEFSGGLGVINEWVDSFNRLSEARGTITNLADAYTDLIIPLRIGKSLLEATGIIESKEKYEELFDTIDRGSQTIENQINFLAKNVETLIADRKELEAGSDAYNLFTGAIDDNINRLSSARTQFENYAQSLKKQRESVEEGSFEYAELNEKIKQAEQATRDIGAELSRVKGLRDQANASVQTEIDTHNQNAESTATLGENYKTNSERIAELINLSRELTTAELEELQSLNSQNEAIQEQIQQRKELAELGADLRPEVANPEPVHVPIEIDIDIPEIELDVPLRSMDEIIKELNEDVSQYVELSGLLGDHSTDNEFAIRRTQDAIQELIANGYHPQSEAIQVLLGQLQLLGEQESTNMEKIVEHFEIAQLLLPQIAGLSSAIHNRRIADLNEEEQQVLGYYDNRLKSERLSEAQRKKLLAERQAVEEKYEQRKSELKKKAARAEKLWGLAHVAINTAVAVMEAAPNIPLMIATGIAGALQAGIILAQPIPEFNLGGEVPGPRHERKDTVPAMLTPGEFVIRKDSAAAAPNALPAMNEDPAVAKEVEQFLVDRKLTGASIVGYNTGGLVATNPSSAAISNVISREVNSSTQIVQQNLNMDSLRDEIRSQTEEIKRMTLKTELSLVDFRQQYDEFIEKERQVGR